MELRTQDDSLINFMAGRRNIMLIFSMAVNAFLAVAVVMGIYAVTHGPQPYELKTEADAAHMELRGRITQNQADQQVVNAAVTNQLAALTKRLDEDDDDIGQLINQLGLQKRQSRRTR